MVALRIAWRYLFSRKTHTAVNVISLISLAGVSVATMAIVCVLSVFNGFTDLAYNQVSAISADIRVEPRSGKVIASADSLAAAIRGVDGVDVAEPTIEERALAAFAGKQMPVRLKGVTPEYDRLTSIRSLVKNDGEFSVDYSDGATPEATLSVGVALELGARPGSHLPIEVYMPRRVGRINPANPAGAFRSDSLAISGVYQAEQADYDTDMILVPLEVTRRLLGYSAEAGAIEVGLAPQADEAAVVRAVEDLCGPDFTVKNRLQQQEATFRMIGIEKWITFFLLAFILIIASFNVISTLSMLVIEKQDNIATLSALGASEGMIARIFRLEGWLISLTGGLTGIAFGVMLCLLQQATGFLKLGGDHDMMVTDIYPVRVEAADMAVVMLLVAVIGWAASSVTSGFTRRRLRNQNR